MLLTGPLERQLGCGSRSSGGHTSEVAISGLNEPEAIQVSPVIRLRPFDPQDIPDDQFQMLLPCYQDRETVRMVDGPNAEPYDLDKLTAMFRYMSTHGELYLIELLTADGGWVAIGDAGLQPSATPVVLSPEFRGRGIGRAVIKALIERARVLGWQSVEVSEIYDYNVASRRTYESLGFVIVGDTELGHRYRLALS